MTIFQLFILIGELILLSYSRDHDEHTFDSLPEDVKVFESWLLAEVLLRVGMIFSSILYLLIRKMFRERKIFELYSFEEN